MTAAESLNHFIVELEGSFPNRPCGSSPRTELADRADYDPNSNLRRRKRFLRSGCDAEFLSRLCRLRVCAVQGGAFQWVETPPATLQSEPTGAAMEVTK